jgi:hypothetical protein
LIIDSSSNIPPFLLTEINNLTIYPAEKPQLSRDSISNYLKRIQFKIDSSRYYRLSKDEIGQAFRCARIAKKSTIPCPKSGILGIGTNLNGEFVYFCFDPMTSLCFYVLNDEVKPLRMKTESCSEYYIFWEKNFRMGERSSKNALTTLSQDCCFFTNM